MKIVFFIGASAERTFPCKNESDQRKPVEVTEFHFFPRETVAMQM